MVRRDIAGLKLTREVLASLYDYATILAKSKYKNGVSILKTRHVGYELEDFVQEVVILIAKDFDTKVFDNFAKLKAYTVKVMHYHYLKEKRKYFYTKQRGEYQCYSLEEPACKVGEDYKLIGDTIVYENSVSAEDLFTYHNLLSKNLYIVLNWPNITICKQSELRQLSGHNVISVNFFIKCQRELGMNDTCKYFKSQGLHMTKNFYKELSMKVVDYARDNNLLVVSPDTLEEKKQPRRYATFEDTRKSFEDIQSKMNTCTCGHVNDETSIYQSAWQCPKCGRIHDRDTLLALNSNVKSEVSRMTSMISL